MRSFPRMLARILRRQPVCLALTVAIYGLLWAVGQPVNASAVVIYTFVLVNLTVPTMELLTPVFSQRKFPYDWLLYLFVLATTIPFMVAVATVPVFWVVAQPGSRFAWYLATSWKFPSLVTFIFGIVSYLYRTTKNCLERRNLELQQAVELRNAEREVQDKELERARDIQQALLPQTVPQIAGFEVAGLWEPARVVGGDYFDVIKLSEARLAICIADVVGKSVSAALLMANVQATVRAFSSDSVSPAWLCTRVNAVLANNIARDKFVTLFYGVLDAGRSSFTYTNAGHPAPILMSINGAAKRLDKGGAVLGIFPDWKYEEAAIQLAGGDRLLLFTDGITEAATSDGEEFGEERLIDLLKSSRARTPAELNALVLKQARRFCDSQMADDATLIVIAAQNSQRAGA